MINVFVNYIYLIVEIKMKDVTRSELDMRAGLCRRVKCAQPPTHPSTGLYPLRGTRGRTGIAWSTSCGAQEDERGLWNRDEQVLSGHARNPLALGLFFIRLVMRAEGDEFDCLIGTGITISTTYLLVVAFCTAETTVEVYDEEVLFHR